MKAVELKLVSATSLDTKAKGSRISMMKRGMNVSVEIIERHYENLEEQIGRQEIVRLLHDFQEDKPIQADSLKGMRPQTKPAKQKASKQRAAKLGSANSKVSESPASFNWQGELEEANTRIAKLEARIAELEEEKRSLDEKLEESERKPIRIQGWSIIQRKAGGGDCKYWYAGKSISGRMRWIYLGKVLDLKAAKSKIENEEKKREQRER